jgi:hypothetical protein
MIDLQGKIHSQNGHQPIELNDPQQVWIVQSGSIAIFAATINHNQTGQRQYLCTINAHEAIFGAAEDHQRLLAVPMGNADLLELDRDCWQNLCQQQDPRIQTWLSNWLSYLAPIVATQPFPSSALQAENTAHYSLVDQQTIQVAEMCWVEIQSGTACLQGMTDMPLTAESMPLPSTMWLSSIGDAQIATRPLSQISPIDLLRGLGRFHTCLFRSIQLSNTRQQQIDLSRLADRDQLNQQLTLATLETLAGTLPAAQQRYSSVGDPLLLVVKAVGRFLQVEIRPPAISDRVAVTQDPLATIVRASRLRKRRVLLRGRWWEQDNGALVAYTKDDQQPIALLPTKNHSYEVFNPNFPRLQPVNEKLAATISPVAYMFYRSLPAKAMQAIDILKFGLQGRRKDLLAIAFTGVAVAILGLVIPHATLIIMDSAIPDSDRGLLLQIGFGLLVTALGTALFQLAQGFSLLRLETTTDHATQSGVWDRLLNLPVSFFRQYTTGDLQSRVSSVSAIRRQLSGRNLINLVSSVFTLWYFLGI